MKSELWWLIEVSDGAALYATLEGDGAWSRDPMKAARFATEKAAKFAMTQLHLWDKDRNGGYSVHDVRVCEHMFINEAAIMLERECADGDRLCEAFGISRTEGGSLNVPRMLSRIYDHEAALAEAAAKEREECALIAEDALWLIRKYGYCSVAEQIRARSDKP